MPDWVISLGISLVTIASTAAVVGVAWGTLNERVANLKEQVQGKASTESVEHITRSLDEIKELVSQLVAKLPKQRGKS